jgi:NADH-quinone oxidoreductase subunit L
VLVAAAPLTTYWLGSFAALVSLIEVGGWIQFAPLWHPFSTWLDPVARPFVEPSSSQEWISSAIALLLGLAGIGIAYVLYGARRVEVPATLPVLEKKFYWDELYDLVWYRTSDLLTRTLYTLVETPLIGGSITAVTGAVGLGSRELSVAQNGLVRTYALALAGGLAVLAVVFLAVR